jgi:hypothetical protein
MSTLGVATQGRSPHFFSLPATGLGKWSASLFILAVALVLVFNIVVLPAHLPEMAENAVGLTVFLGVLATGFTGLAAIVLKRERSWTAFLAVVVMLLVVAMNVAPFLFGE